jgi:AcrR family transcriptional regulator
MKSPQLAAKAMAAAKNGAAGAQNDAAAPRNRGEARRGRTRVALLKAAHALMSRRGVEAVSLQEITEAADLGTGTFYIHFNSKDDIARAVLDCHIANLTIRQETSVAALGLRDPAAVIAVSARSCLNELLTNPLWFWWLKHPDLLVERMRAGFKHYGHRDLAAARAARAVNLPTEDLAATWGALIWQIVAGARDIVDGVRDASSEAAITIGILQSLGVPPEQAKELATIAPLPYPKIAVDFSFVLTDAD